MDLASLTDAALVADALADALNVTGRAGQDLAQTLRGYLRSRHMLLIFDNFEHVLPAAAFVADLLTAAPWVKMLATSREPLEVRAEQVHWLEPLANVDAIQLFTERAQAAGGSLAAADDDLRVYA